MMVNEWSMERFIDGQWIGSLMASGFLMDDNGAAGLARAGNHG